MSRMKFLVRAWVCAGWGGVAAGQCTVPDWIARFEGGEVGGAVRAFASFDSDGAGPEPQALYALHYPRYSTDMRPARRWTGRTWQPVGGAELVMDAPLDGKRCAMASFDADGPGPAPAALYIAGNLRVERNAITEGGMVARLEPDGWRAPGGTPFFQPGKWCYDLEVFDADGAGPASPVLVAAGELGAHAWNGSAWLTLDSSSNPALPIDLFDAQSWDADGAGPTAPVLIAAGSFDFGASTAAPFNYVAAWNGAQWTPLGPMSAQRPDITLALAVFDADAGGPLPPALYALSSTSPDPSRHQGGLVRWDGATWQTVRAFAVPAPTLSGSTAGPQLGRMVVHDDDGTGPQQPALYIGMIRSGGGSRAGAAAHGHQWASAEDGSLPRTTVGKSMRSCRSISMAPGPIRSA